MLHLYKASAGSGKTFTLAYEYIKMLLGIKGADGKYRLNTSDRSESHRSILAITFTNKATEEMKRRILHELAVLADMEPGWSGASPYMARLCAEFSASEQQVRHASMVALKSLLMDFSFFNISTIDAFFQVVLRTFAREAELTGNYELELDNDRAIDFGVNEMFSWINADPDAPGVDRVVQWITTYLVQQLHIGKDIKLFNRTSKVHSDFTSLITGISNDTFAVHYDEIMNYLRHTPRKLLLFANALTERLDSMLNEIKAGCEVALTVIRNHVSEPGKVTDNLVKAFVKYANNPHLAAERDASKTPVTVHGNLEKAYDAARKKYYAAHGGAPDLDAAISSACACIAEYPSEIKLLEQIRGSLFVLGLIDKVYEFIEKFREENNTILLSDTNSLLREIIGDSDAPFVYERVGLWLRHFLIDEFQDTSRMQWLNIRPLLNESMANDSDSLIIGDEKQCIYRFRNSDPTLLQCQVQQQFAGRAIVSGDTPEGNTNWRSAPAVVEFNNALFHALASIVGVEDIYANVRQQIPTRDGEYPGYVSLMPFSASKLEDFREMALKRMTEEMERQLRQGYAYNDLCVLVRDRKDGDAVISRLMKITETAGSPDCEYPLLSGANVISDDAMLIARSPVIKIIVSTLRALANPALNFRGQAAGDEPAKFHSRAEMMAMFSRYNHFSSLGNSSEKALELALSDEPYQWDLWSEMPEMECFNLPSLVEHIIQHRISPRDREAENMFISAFQDLVCDYCSTSTPDLGGFLKWWDQASYRLSVSAPMDAKAVRVMTIHKAKGLEFKCTHIPFLSYKVPKFSNHEWFVAQPLAGIDADIMPPLLPLIPGAVLDNTPFAPQYDEIVREQLLDELNVLYVAFTRAGQELIASYKANDTGSVGALITPACQSLTQYTTSLPGELVSGSPDTVPVRKSEQKTALDPQDSVPMLPYEVYDGTTVWDQTQVDFDPERIEAVSRGTALHNLFAMVTDVASVPAAIEKAVRRHIISRAEVPEIKVLLTARVSQPDTARWFCGYKRVLRERPITTADGEHYRPDRVVWTSDGHIDIIDYKFGAERPTAHARQLRNYMRRFVDMGYSNLRAFVWYVDTNEIVPVNVG